MHRQPVDGDAAEHDPAAALHLQAHDGLQRGGFPGPVTPEQHGHFAAVDRERDTAQDLRLAVPGIEAVDVEQRHASPHRTAGAVWPR